MKKIIFLLTAMCVSAFLSGCSTHSGNPTRTRSKAVSPMSGTQVRVSLAPTTASGTIPGCGGNYVGYVSYTKTVANGWGWAPDTNNTTVFTASDGGGRTNTKIRYQGKNGDTNCGMTTVTVPNPPFSAAYRFTIYFTNNLPTTNYPILLNGFQP